MGKQSFLMMPDISGFTDFVRQTEITHSQHIISELLELLIDANSLDLTVSEIEGDAIFFYKDQDVPSISAILEQAQKMYVLFHNHLRLYEVRRVCQCGACSTASRLSLKIIIHCADLGFITVKEQKKPHGSDVILIHQLLKNDIPENEYLLLTQDFEISEAEIANFNPDLCLENGYTEYEKFGKVNYSFIPLQPLQSLVSEPEAITPSSKMQEPIVWEGTINRNTQDVFEIISNLDFRLLWNSGVDKLEYEPRKMNRVGTLHTCLVNGKYLEFETVTNDFGTNKFVYGERLSTLPIVKEFSLYYILESKDDITDVRIEVHYVPLPFIGWLIVPLFKRTFYKNIVKTFNAIKQVCENSKDVITQ